LTVQRSPLGVFTWNIHFQTADVLNGIQDLSPRPDVVTLQEVTNKHLDGIRKSLGAMGYAVLDSCDAQRKVKRYGNVIAVSSDTTIHRVALTGFPWPQLALGARIETQSGPLSVITAHIPNGSGNGWRKIDALEALRSTALNLSEEALIITGDFNEPRYEPLQNGHVITWGQQRVGEEWRTWDTWTDRDGVADSGKRWDSAVRWFFEERPRLRNAFWEARGVGEMEPSHISRDSPRWFDHIFVSQHLAVQSCRYLHDWRAARLSDHSPLLASLT
jgi:endonuclease/exonuclease/phosphatase family metal-dependent hydrolase